MDKHEFRNIQKKLRLTNEETAKVLGVQLIQVQMWACGVWPIPQVAENFLHSLQNAGMDYYRGYKDGYKDGHHREHKEGYETGQEEGSESMFNDWFEVR